MYRKAATYIRGRKKQNQLGRALCAAIRELNISYSEIVSRLEAEQIRGVRDCKDTCPMAQFLQKRLVGFENLSISVGFDFITVSAGRPPVAVGVGIGGTALSRVIECFDNSLIPNLVVRGATYNPQFESGFESIRVIDQRAPMKELATA